MHLLHVVGGTANPDEDVLFAVDNENIAFVHQRPRDFRKLAYDWVTLTFDRVQSGVEFISHMPETGCGSTRQNPNNYNKHGRYKWIRSNKEQFPKYLMPSLKYVINRADSLPSTSRC